MRLLATIVEGEADWADVFFLLAVFLAALAVISTFVADFGRFTMMLLCGWATAIALAWLVL